MDELRIEVADALVIKPGDRVLLTAPHMNWSHGFVEMAQAKLKVRFPDTEFMFVTGVEEVVVQRRTCQDNPDDVFASGSHLHECERELDHRSRVHRCACGAQWWRPEETPNWEAGDG